MPLPQLPPVLRPILTWGALTVVAVVVSLTMVRLVDDPTAPRADDRVEHVAAAPGQGAVAVLRGWDARRAAAYARGDVAAVRRLYADGSGAGERDARLLRSYVDRGLVVERLRQQLLAVELLDQAPNRLTVRVRDRLAAATVLSAGRRVELPRDSASTNVVVLVRQHDEWRVWSVDPVRDR